MSKLFPFHTEEIMADLTVNITDASFEAAVLKSDKPVLVDFFATWCGPCRALMPVLDEVAAEYSEKITITKMDVDANQSTPSQFGIRSIPTLVLFKNGKVVAERVGGLSKSQLQEFINNNL